MTLPLTMGEGIKKNFESWIRPKSLNLAIEDTFLVVILFFHVDGF
ncbi:hypothetical protein ACPR111641_03295 [Acinetobacter pragensis]